MAGYPPYSDAEAGSAGDGYSFDDQSIRRGFIRKVYSILTVQLLVSMAFIAIFVLHEPTKRFVQQNAWLVFVAMGVQIVTMLIIACCGEVRRNFPMNFILLAIFTLSMSFMLGVISSVHTGETVMLAAGITAAVCFALTIFAFQTKLDFTVCGGEYRLKTQLTLKLVILINLLFSGVLFAAAIILLIFGIVSIFFPGRTIKLIYASVGALLFSVYLIYDTQLMLGGKHKYSISPEEYIFAALNLYMDVVQIFIQILTILGIVRDD